MLNRNTELTDSGEREDRYGVRVCEKTLDDLEVQQYEREERGLRPSEPLEKERQRLCRRLHIALNR